MSIDLIDLKTGLLAQVPPLTFRNADGNLRERSETVNTEIRTVWPSTHSERLASLPHLQPETLVFFTRLTRYFDRDFCGELMLQLGKRTARIVRRFVRGLSEIAAEEILMKVDIQIVELVLAATPSKQSEFLEVSFAGAVKRLTLDAVKSYRRSLLGGKRGWIPTDEEGDPLEGARELIDTAQNPEQHVLELEEESFRQQMLRTAFGVVEDKRALEVVILRFGYGWPIVSKDRRKNDLVSHFGATEPQIRYWISKTVKAMRDALENGENK